MPPRLLIDPTELDFANLVDDLAGIRKINPQRYEMEQLAGIVHLDPEAKIVVGFKDVSDGEFWVRGHMPDFPLLPGVLICEAAAQLAAYYITTQNLGSGDFVAFGGMEKVRFRGTVLPGDRLVMVAKLTDLRPGRRAVFDTQGIVNGTLVFHGEVIGVPFSKPPSDGSSA